MIGLQIVHGPRRRAVLGGGLAAAVLIAAVLIAATLAFALTHSAAGGRASPAPATSGPLFLAASNTAAAFTSLAPGFIAHHHPVQLSFGASAVLAAMANTPSNPAVLFASADEANVDKLIAVGDPTTGSPGTCTGTCRGIGSTKAQYAVGRIVVFSCRAGGRTLAPAQGAPGCAAPAGGYLAKAPRTAADVVALLRADPTFRLTIADPGPLPPGSGPATAPYGLAAYQALTSRAPGGGGLTFDQFDALVARGQIVKGANVSATQTNVVTGAAHMAMLPRSFVVSPTGDDTDSWTTVAARLHAPIAQWAVVLDKPGRPSSTSDQAIARAFLGYLRSARGQAALVAFGYEPLAQPERVTG